MPKPKIHSLYLVNKIAENTKQITERKEEQTSNIKKTNSKPQQRKHLEYNSMTIKLKKGIVGVRSSKILFFLFFKIYQTRNILKP
jgi:hypothetical protein